MFLIFAGMTTNMVDTPMREKKFLSMPESGTDVGEKRCGNEEKDNHQQNPTDGLPGWFEKEITTMWVLYGGWEPGVCGVDHNL